MPDIEKGSSELDSDVGADREQDAGVASNVLVSFRLGDIFAWRWERYF